MTACETRTQILDAAEELFAAKGVGGTSLRTIVAKADVNLAAIHYHFGSKAALTVEMFSRRLTPIVKEQQRRLAKCEQLGCCVEDVLNAFIEPILELRHSDNEPVAFLRILGHTYVEPDEVLFRALQDRFGSAVDHLARALRKAVPELTDEVFQARLLFALGALSFSIGDAVKRTVLGELKAPMDITARELVPFLAAGFKAQHESSPHQ